jgi:hypothetical protein
MESASTAVVFDGGIDVESSLGADADINLVWTSFSFGVHSVMVLRCCRPLMRLGCQLWLKLPRFTPLGLHIPSHPHRIVTASCVMVPGSWD